MTALQDKERYLQAVSVDKEKVRAAMDRAVERLRRGLDKFTTGFPGTYSENFKYETSERFNWESGMMTGCWWLAYEYTGDEVFREAAEKHIAVYREHAETGEWLQDHDTGFIYSPSCVAGYRVTGDEELRDIALKAADILLDHYDMENHFIIRMGYRSADCYEGYRTLVDSMMNIPLFFFAYEQTGDKKYYDAAVEHYHTTMKYLIREDGSSFHHYQFDPTTGKPVKGVTLQGHADDSCWSRGHSWLLYGFPIAYSYTNNEEIIDVHRDIANFYLNKLAKNNIPYWDMDFTEGSDEPRDASAGAVTVCGFLEMSRRIADEERKQILTNAAAAQMNALIDSCEAHGDEDGLIVKVTHFRPPLRGVEECAVYGDYFYMEALMRYLNPDWKRYW